MSLWFIRKRNSILYLVKYENRRFNKNETGKQFYLRRKQEMNEILESDAYKNWYVKSWIEYKKANGK